MVNYINSQNKFKVNNGKNINERLEYYALRDIPIYFDKNGCILTQSKYNELLQKYKNQSNQAYQNFINRNWCYCDTYKDVITRDLQQEEDFYNSYLNEEEKDYEYYLKSIGKSSFDKKYDYMTKEIDKRLMEYKKKGVD